MADGGSRTYIKGDGDRHPRTLPPPLYSTLVRRFLQVCFLFFN
jgi:hypothetical protein